MKGSLLGTLANMESTLELGTILLWIHYCYENVN